MRRNIALIYPLLPVFVLLIASSAGGQIIHGQPASGGTGVIYTHWKLESESGSSSEVSQVWAPLSGMIPLADNIEAAFFVSGARSEFEYGGTSSDLGGLSDTRLQISRSMSDDRYIFSLGVNLPTGKKELEPDAERQIIETLAVSFLDFPLRRYGEGFGLSFLVGTAAQLGEINAGIGAQYEYIGPYTPYVGVKDYDPGDLLNIYAGGDVSRGDMSWSGNLLFTAFTADRIDASKTLRQSTQLELQLAGAFDNERHRIDGMISYTFRGRNERYDSATEEVIERLKLYGNEFYLTGGYTALLEDGWSLGPAVSLKLIEGDEDSFGKSRIFLVSGLAGKEINEKFAVNAAFRYMSGKADDSRLDISGFQITTGISATF